MAYFDKFILKVCADKIYNAVQIRPLVFNFLHDGYVIRKIFILKWGHLTYWKKGKQRFLGQFFWTKLVQMVRLD